MNHQLGKFKISEDSLRRNWRDLLVLFANVVPVQAEWRYDTRDIVYTAYSDLFEKIPDNCKAPFYDFEFSRGLDGSVDMKCVRCEAEAI